MAIKKHYEVIRVSHVPLDEESIDYLAHNPEVNTSLVELLIFIAGLPLKDQVYMLANTLTVSGFTQKEIAEAIGVSHQAYRNRLLDIRKELLQRDGLTLK